MKRWHLTLGLAGTALVAAVLAPRLQAYITPVQPAVVPPKLVDPPVAPPVAAKVEQGRLIVDAGLDRTAVLANTTSERFLTITVTAPAEGGESVHTPVNVAVVMDASGSMSAAGKIDFAKDATKAVVGSMTSSDAFSLVTFNDDARVVVPARGAVADANLYRQIDRVYEGGGTNLYAGMDQGKREIGRVLDSGEVGRMIILSDGNANVGITDPDTLARFASDAAARGITVSAMGLGVDYNEDLLARIADVGGGTYDYIDDPSELTAVFENELRRTSSVVTRSTAVQIQLPANIQPIDVVGWDATPTSNGWTVFMGDLYAGTTRKIVARVNVTPSNGQPMEINAVANYVDVLDAKPASSSDIAQVTVTSDPNQVESSLDTEKAAAAGRAWGNHYLQMSTKAYADGNGDLAEALLGEGTTVLRRTARRTGNAVLEQDADTLDQQRTVYKRHAPSSERGRRAIKMNKETVRGASR